MTISRIPRSVRCGAAGWLACAASLICAWLALGAPAAGGQEARDQTVPAATQEEVVAAPTPSPASTPLEERQEAQAPPEDPAAADTAASAPASAAETPAATPADELASPPPPAEPLAEAPASEGAEGVAAEAPEPAPQDAASPTPEPDETAPAQERAPIPVRAPLRSGVKGPKTVSNAELVRLGFFQDFEELDLDSLLNPDVLEIKTTLAAGREQAIETAPGSVTVLTADDLRNLGARTLSDVLRTVAGLDVTTDSLGRGRIVARGMPTGAFAALSEGVLLLLNGHRMNEDISGGGTALNVDIPVEGIVQLEILRGPASALYGEAALGAVVNVVTEEAGSYRGVRVSSTFGSFGTHQNMVRVANEIHGIKIVGSIRFAGTSGASPWVEADAQTLRDRAAGQALSLAPGRAEDGHRTLETLYHIASGRFDAHWRVAQATADPFAGYANSLGKQGELYSKQTLFDLRYRNEVRGLGALSVKLDLTNNDNRQLFEALPPGFAGQLSDGRPFVVNSPIFLQARLKTARRGLTAVVERDVSRDHQVTAGLALEREATRDLEALSNLDFETRLPFETMAAVPSAVAEASRSSLGLFLQDVWSQSARVTVTGNLRLDWLSDVGARVSPRAAAVISLPRDLTLKLAYGQSFRAPTFAELHFNLPGYQGNPDLRPVTSQTFETALGLRRTNLRLNAGAYVNLVRGAILAERPDSPLETLRLSNAADIHAYGLEVEGRASLGLSVLFGNLTLQSSRFADGGGRVPGLPAVMATLGTTIVAGRHETATVTWLIRSTRPRAADDARRRLAGYGVLNVNLLRERALRGLDLSLTIENALNLKYHDPAPAFTLPGDYERPGRSVRLGARYRF